MFKVPFYTQANYRDIIAKTYEQNDKSERFSLSDFFEVFTENFVNNYSFLDARDLWNYFTNKSLNEIISFGWSKKKLQDIIIALKLLMPTLWTCEYFLWNCKKWTHSWIDILLPKWTPILSFSDGVVSRIKQWDWVKKDEGNCVVVQSGDKWYSYKHLDSIQVKYWDKIGRWDCLWTCWSTGQSSQFHLHFQIDASTSPFNPYWSNQLNSVIKNTLDPLPFLRNIFWYTKIFVDMPLNTEYKQAIESLFAAWILKWDWNKIMPEYSLARRQAAIVFDRLAKKYKLYQTMAVVLPTFTPYKDTDLNNIELDDALKSLQKYGIMMGNQWNFFPNDNVKWEEWIAVLGRFFWGLKNAHEGTWYNPYVHSFEEKNFIMKNRFYLGKSIVRKDAFLVLYRVLKNKWFLN
jgi:hypothetical protein